MILISAGLVLAAVVLLIAGFVLAKPFLIMWSIVVSVLSALFLVIGALLRRHELFPGGGQAAEPATPPPPAGLVPPGGTPYPQTGPMAGQLSPRPHPYQRTAPVPSPVPSPAPGVPTPHRPAAGGISPDAIVLVIPGRKRYHVQACRQLAGRDHEELTYEEAREEGFTPCTACLPDAALGGRQLPPADDAEPARNRAEASEPTRDLRPPVVQPKPAAKASTPASEPAASPAEAGWFARSSQPEGPSAREGASPPGGQDDPHPETSRSGDQPRPSESRSDHESRSAEEAGPHDPGRPSPQNRPPTGQVPGRSSTDPARSPVESGRSGSGEGIQDPKRSSQEPGRGQDPARSSRQTESGRDARGSGRSAQESGRSPLGPGQGSGRPRQEQGKPPYVSTLEPDMPDADPDSGPDTRPQPRVTADGTPVPPPSASTVRGSTTGEQGTGERAEQGAGTREPAVMKEDQAAPRAGKADATTAGPAGRGQATPHGGAAAASPAGGDRGAPGAGGAGGAIGTGSSGEGRGTRGEGDAGGGRTAADAPEGGRAARREGDPGGERAATRDAGGGASKEGRAASRGDEAGEPSAESGASGEKTVRTRSLFEPASPPARPAAGGAGPVQRPASSAESAKARGPLPKGASGDASGPKTEDGDNGPADDEKGREPGEERRSATVKVIVGTRRFHSSTCPLVKGAGDSGVETMTRSRAEAAGLTPCSVCQHDRETVS